MAATFGAKLPTGVSTPTDCVLKSTSEKESVEIYTYRDKDGLTVRAVPGKMKTFECTAEFIGKAPLTLTAGDFATGTYRQTNVKITESNSEFPASTTTFKKFQNL